MDRSNRSNSVTAPECTVNFLLNPSNLSPPKQHSLLQTSTFSGVSALNTQNLAPQSPSSLTNYELSAGNILLNMKAIPPNSSFHSGFTNDVPFANPNGYTSSNNIKQPQYNKPTNTNFNSSTSMLTNQVPLVPIHMTKPSVSTSHSNSGSMGLSLNGSGGNIYSSTSTPSYTNNNINGVKHCAHCKTTSTPLWRKGWTISANSKPVSLCNACGIRYSKNQFCPYCYYIYNKLEEPYNADERRPDLLAPNRTIPTWIRCEQCFRWVHFKCELEKQKREKLQLKYTNGEWPSVFDKMDLDDHAITAEEEHQFLLNLQQSYKCPTCRIPGVSIVFNYPTPADFKSHSILSVHNNEDQ